ncbi:hypothetical protein L1994_02940 [Methanomicrobium antiquum]|uniref:Uncharacterized protein n=1 Tax=Methanomicrobium antiquum TaxID=487686 RepID=A0AAF0JNF4_9EURY|nr:hypothetical protein [Methanomicrobium antiquum]WFN37361.1 hypothetical protein L1994_02940 [Methanomicrobium antiquum]
MLVIPSSVLADPFESVLTKDYNYKNVTIRNINSLDIANPAVSKVDVLSTAGDGSDIDKVNIPKISSVKRTFTTTSGKFQGVAVTIDTSQMSSDIDWSGISGYNIYTKRTVPTLKFTVPGYRGNPMLVQISDDLTKDQASDLSTFIDNSKPTFVYHPDRIMHVNIQSSQYRGSGTFSSEDYNTSDISWTLNKNIVQLSSGFSAPADNSRTYEKAYSEDIPEIGKYSGSAIYLDNDAKTVTVLAGFPVLILDNDYTGTWTEQTNGDIKVSFATNPSGLSKVVWLMLDKDADYSLDMKINTSAVVGDASSRWGSLAGSGDITGIMYDMVRNDVGESFATYKFKAAGGSEPSYANNWANIAISEGYGASGQNDGSYAIVPKATYDAFKTGNYYLYLMGLNDKHDVIAFDQTEKSLKKEDVNGGQPIQPNTPVVINVGTVGDTVETETDVVINLTTSNSTSGSQKITVTIGTEPPEGGSNPPSGEKMLMKFLTIEASISNDDLSSVRIEASYNETQVKNAGIDESKLRLYYWDIISETYKETTDSGVDTVNNKVYGYVTHLTTFAIITKTTETPTTATPTPTGGGGGGGGGGSGGGGGFAGSIIAGGEAGTITTVTTTGRLDTDKDGVVETSIEIDAKDELAGLVILRGTTALDIFGDPLREVTIIPVSKSSAPYTPEKGKGKIFSFNGMYYECSPAGATFDPPIDIVFQLTEDQFYSLEDNQHFSVQYYDESTGEWVEVRTYVNPGTHQVIGEVLHFSTYALLVKDTAFEVVTETVTTAPLGEGEKPAGEIPVWAWALVIVVILVLIAGIWIYYNKKKS